MPPEDTSHLSRERFIHDDLVLEAEMGLGSLYDTWALQSKITPFMIVWPARPVEFHGHKTESALPFDLPEDRSKWDAEVRRIADASAAYGLLLAEQREDAVVVIFESPHGTKSWRIPILDHGNVRALGDPVELVDTDSIGLLWVPQRKQG